MPPCGVARVARKASKARVSSGTWSVPGAVLQRNGAQLARRHVGMAAQVGQRAIQVSVAGLAGGIEGAAHAQVQVAAARQLQAAIGRTRPVRLRPAASLASAH
jgi:hypothetical protein